MSLRIVVLCSAASAACVSPQSRSLYPTDQAGYNAAVAPMAAEAGARPHPGSVVMDQMRPIETVPASEAPPPPSPATWYCFEVRQTRYRPGQSTGDTTHASSCMTTKAECRAATEATPREEARAGDRVENTVSTCAAQRTAACTHRWFEAAHEEACAASMDDCQRAMLAYTMPGGAARQSECRLTR